MTLNNQTRFESQDQLQPVWRLRLWGIVQGVGLRPFAVRLAQGLDLAGTVQNRGGLVEIWLAGPRDKFAIFRERLLAEKPAPAVFIRLQVDPVTAENADDVAVTAAALPDQPLTLLDHPLALQELPFPFTILPSDQLAGTAFPAPDLPVCPDCERELLDPDNRRAGHPFISCMHCGPRYSILDRLPYDRAATAMGVFELCPRCAEEYRQPADRRFHAQTVACPDCGPQLQWTGRQGSDSIVIDPLAQAIRCLQAGQIIAVKATGGYHLACDPANEQAVQALRQIKQRDRKPFAVLYPDLAAIAQHALPTPAEQALLLTDARPIVLLARHPDSTSRQFPTSQMTQDGRESRHLAPAVCGASAYLGAFLPSTPIQILLARACGPLVMTSANQTDENLIFQDDAMAAFFQEQPRLSGILGHNRPIRTGLDDSVARVNKGRVQLIRRARGYVPLAIDLGDPAKLDQQQNHPVTLALGGDLKATTALAADGFAWLTQPAGDIASENIAQNWRGQADHLQAILGQKPDRISCDLHPGYHSHRQALTSRLPVQAWQHHHAHIASVMAEHHLGRPVIGVAFDGTGFGLDQTIWGGEFLVCSGAECKRLAHLKAVLLPGGDSGMRDAWRSLAGYLLDAGLPAPPWLIEPTAGDQEASPLAADQRWSIVQAALRHQINCLPNSSLGRLFDAVCALLGLSDINHYEGECGSLLEAQARLAQNLALPAWPMSFDLKQTLPPGPAATALTGSIEADPKPLIKTIFATISSVITIQSTADPTTIPPYAIAPDLIARLALGFHQAVSQMTVAICRRLAAQTGLRDIALSGGVFQNAVLVELVDATLTAEGFSVYWNEKVPPNDGGICLGQVWLTSQTHEMPSIDVPRNSNSPSAMMSHERK